MMLILSIHVTASFCQKADKYTMIEAIDGSQGQIVVDKEAYGGHYVQQFGAYQPMFSCPLPATGDSWVIWARFKDVNLQIKGLAADGTQKEFNWEWQQPDEWSWVSFGRHTRAELGTGILLMRGPTAGSTPGLDAVVFANDDSFNPSIDIPAPVVNYPPITISVDWRKTIAKASPLSYGLNAFGGFSPDITHNASYEANMAEMDVGLLRLHNWGMMNDSATDATGWIDYKTKQWDAAKIGKDLTGAYAYGPTLLINIPSWPSWMDKDGMLDIHQQDTFAKFCAELVKIVNKDLHLHVAYWEITNERDGLYYGDFHDNGGALVDHAKPDHLDDLIALYNKCATAMKAVDPSIKTGGPADQRPDWNDFIARFVSGTAGHLDFFSYHEYASGSKDDSDKHILDRAMSFGPDASRIKLIINKIIPHGQVPLFLDEYNISWSSDNRDPRMGSAKGAVFDALAIVSAIENGVSATTAWNEKDGIYGKMDDSYNLRPGAALFGLLNKRMVGDVVAASSSEPLAIVPYAVRRSNGAQALLLINRSSHNRSVILVSESSKLKLFSVIANSQDPKLAKQSTSIIIPAYSVALFLSGN
jgi:xylan 1,4-beta-xylosidase